MRQTSKLLLPAMTLALAGGAMAQGDLCSTASTISGTGAFAYDTTGLSTSGFNGGGTCVSYNQNFDGFFQWTAPAAGDYIFDTFGTSYDTTLAVHAGIGCAATCAAFNDDFSGLQSQITLLGALAGDTFLVQVSGYSATTGFGPGTLNIQTYTSPCSVADDSFEDNEDCASAPNVTNGTYSGLFASKADPDHFALCVADGDTVSIDILHSVAVGDIDAFLWDAADFNCGTGFGTTALVYGYTSSDDENLVWTNTSGADVALILEVNVWANSTGDCNNYDLVLAGAGTCGATSVGVPFCAPMNNNSTGFPTVMTATMGSGVGSGLHLEATSGPPTQFGYFLIGTGSSDPGIVVSQGRLCLAIGGGNVFGRYNVGGTELNSVGLFDAGGILQNAVGTSTVGSGFDVPSTIPITGSPAIVPGSTWHFQLWHREAGGSSNFSNGLSVTF